MSTAFQKNKYFNTDLADKQNIEQFIENRLKKTIVTKPSEQQVETTDEAEVSSTQDSEHISTVSFRSCAQSIDDVEETMEEEASTETSMNNKSKLQTHFKIDDSFIDAHESSILQSTAISLASSSTIQEMTSDETTLVNSNDSDEESKSSTTKYVPSSTVLSTPFNTGCIPTPQKGSSVVIDIPGQTSLEKTDVEEKTSSVVVIDIPSPIPSVQHIKPQSMSIFYDPPVFNQPPPVICQKCHRRKRFRGEYEGRCTRCNRKKYKGPRKEVDVRKLSGEEIFQFQRYKEYSK